MTVTVRATPQGNKPVNAPKTPATNPMSRLPAMATDVPSSEIAPDVPTSTGRPLVMSLGAALPSVPSSVAQVSAVTVAITPVNSANQSESGTPCGTTALSRAMTAPAPPFASTWTKSRRWPLSNFSATAALSLSL